MWPFKKKEIAASTTQVFELPDVDELTFNETDLISRKEFLDYVLAWCSVDENSFIRKNEQGLLIPEINDPDKPLQRVLYETAFRNLLLEENLARFQALLVDTQHDYTYSRICELAVTLETTFDIGFIRKFQWKLGAALVTYGPISSAAAATERLRILFYEVPTIWVMYAIQFSMHRTTDVQ